MKTPSPLAPRQLLRRLWPELLTLALVSAAFTLLPVLGLLWLAQQDWLAWWLLLCAALMGVLVVLRWWRPDAAGGSPLGAPRPGAAAAEREARAALAALAAETSADDLANRDAVDRLLRRVVSAVASAYAPDDDAAMLNFTLPEMLLMLEEVARRLRHILSAELPVLRHLRLSWAAKGSDLIGRGIKPARGLANAWRVMRLADPLGAVVAELRALAIEQGVTLLGREARAVMAGVLVREIGEVAIELYSGVYRERAEPPARGAGVRAPEIATGPLRVLVTGQRNSGKSSLVNALLGRELAPVGLTRTTSQWTAYTLSAPLADAQTSPQETDEKEPTCAAAAPTGADAGGESWELIDSPPLAARPDPAWLEQVGQADLILWTVAAHRADRAADERAIKALRQQIAADPRLRPVPLVLVLTHADRLEPIRDWRPPYDPLRGQSAKERNMARALHAASSALVLEPEHGVLVAVGEGLPAWNLSALRRQLRARWPEAEQKRLERSRRAEGLLKAGVDLLRSVPGAIERARHFLRR